MIEAVRSEIRARGTELGFAGEPSVLQVGGASWRGGRVHFAVVRHAGTPALFARVTRNPADAARLSAERDLLTRLAASAHYAAHVAEPLFYSEVSGRHVLCERAVHGRRLSAARSLEFGAAGLERGLAVALPLAIDLARAAPEEVGRGRYESVVLDPLRAFWLAAGGRHLEIDAALAAVMDGLGARPRLVVTHGDFIAKNMHVDRSGRAVLIDWETATAQGLPLVDLHYFITRWAYVSGAPWREKADRVRRFYTRDTGARELARRKLAADCAALDLPGALVAPMQHLHFLYKARIKAETTSLDNAVTQEWLELFSESARGALGTA